MMRFLKNFSLASIALLFSAGILISQPTLAQSGSYSLSYSGRLTQADGAPLGGPVDLTVKFWTAAAAGNTLTAPIEFANITLNQGVFTLPLELNSAQVSAVFGQGADPVFIEVTAAGKTYPRQQYTYVPFALRVPVDNRTLIFDSDGKLALSLTSQPSANQFLTKDGSGRLAWGSPLVTTIQGQNIASTAPTSGQILTYSGGQWVPQNPPVAVTSGGTVTNVTGEAPLTVTTGTTTPVISLAQASGSVNGYLAATDWSSFNAKQNSLGFVPLNKAGDTMAGALSMNGSDVSSVGNIGMAASKTLLLSNNATDPNGLTAADKGKTWFNTQTNQVKYWDGSSAQALGISGAGLTNLNGLTGSTQTFATGISGTSPIFNSIGTVHTLNIPLASGTGVTAGLVSNSDFAAFTNKVSGITGGTGISALTTGATATVSLSSLGTAGTYAKVTTNAQGQVISGDTLTASDIPGLDANKITSGVLGASNGGTGVNSTASFPTSGVVVTRDATETLTNKTLSAATINGASTIGGSTTIDTTGTINSGAQIVTGNVTILGNSTTANKLVLNDKGSVNSVALKAPNTLASSLIWELPNSNGSSGQVLSTNGSGTLSWVSAAVGSVTSVSGTAPISVATGTSTPVISIAPANGTANGYLSSADWTTFNNKQTAGNYITALTGDITAAGPGSAAASLAAVAIAGTSTKVSYDVKGRVTSGTSLAATDLPSHSAALITSGTLTVANGGTGLSTTPSNGQILIGNGINYTLGTLTAGTGISINNSAGAITVNATADASTKVSKAGDTMSGALSLPTNGLIAGTNQLVLANGNVGNVRKASPANSRSERWSHSAECRV